MAIVVGELLEGWGPGHRRFRELIKEVRSKRRGKAGEEDYAVDLAFRTWDPRDVPEFVGPRPGMVGRRQRRFIVWIGVPPGLPDAQADREWLVLVLAEVAELVRQYLPTKSKRYPAEELANEVLALRDSLII
jgi:hypothetical protein